MMAPAGGRAVTRASRPGGPPPGGELKQEAVLAISAHLLGQIRALWLLALAAACFGLPGSVRADRFGTPVPMYDKGAATFYVHGYVSGLGPTEMMVDTGSGYLTINEEALKTLSAQGKVHYVKPLRGVLANGAELVVPVYRVDALRIGAECWLRDVHAAVFPGRTRFILGLSALAKAAPFVFEFDPPQLLLSNCGKADLAAEAGTAPADPNQARIAAVAEP